jgi:CRP-like cAMP-binding protein
MIVKQDEPSEFVFIVIEGDVIAERDGIVTTVVNAGRGFGDLTLEAGSAYGFSARAVTHTHVLRVGIEDLVETMLDYPEIAVGIVRALGERLKEAGKQLAALGRQLQDGEHMVQDSRDTH